MLQDCLLADINRRVDAINQDVVALRRTLHQFPELSYREFNTANQIGDLLKDIPGVIVMHPTETSIMAVLKGNNPRKTIALRSDLDAIAIHEENEVPYRSANAGVMHACGHDGHTAMLVGAANVLAGLRSELKGEIRFIFQHAEEQHPGGAKDLVAKRVLDGVDAIIALHLFSLMPAGKIGLAAGPLMAAPDNFDLTICGKGGHAGRPEDTVDPVVVSAQVISGLQHIVSRKTSAQKQAVLSITSIHGGTAYNVIPEQIKIKGTVRTFEEEVRQQIPRHMESIINGICNAYGASYTFNYERGYDPVVNDGRVINLLQDVLNKAIGADNIVQANPVMWGEDFSAYLKKVPGAMIFVGAGFSGCETPKQHHHPRFDFDEKALKTGVQTLVYSAFGLLDSIDDWILS
ncbi:amidohydrolase [Dehalobacter sp. DCM]|uniref:M20 metallopeptidase family protein n=1 Tax=Dehalobacter sp. DCM TaxID=2907827 RepID=UPI0030813D8E|nr:amidohydrolase [Dehalobacter sp. DCM]